MIHVSAPCSTPPETFQTPLQRQVYETLTALAVPFQRVATDEVITMEDCARVDEVLGMRMVKTLFLCNRQRTEHYLFVTAGDKPFRAKDFSAALGVTRVSFAPMEEMETVLGTRIGAATVFSVLLPSAGSVRLVLDREVLAESYYGCSDGTTTGYLKLRTEGVLHRFLPAAGRTPELITV